MISKTFRAALIRQQPRLYSVKDTFQIYTRFIKRNRFNRGWWCAMNCFSPSHLKGRWVISRKYIYIYIYIYQLSDHMNNARPYPCGQSVYKPFHSTITALLKVQSDILRNMDDHKITLLVMLDLSVEFDIISHSILLEILVSGFVMSVCWWNSF